MLEHACKFEKAFDLFEVRDPFYKVELGNTPDCVDWKNGKKMCQVLKTFYELTVKISGSLYVTSNAFFLEIAQMLVLLKGWVRGSALDVRPMGLKMKEKFDKYWGDPTKMNKFIFFALVVDPRYKFKFLKFMLEESYGNEIGTSLAASVKDELYALYDEYKALYQPSNDHSIEVESSSQQEHDTPYLLVDKYEKQIMLEGDDVANDLDVYLNEKERKVPNVKNFDLLTWWKVNEPRLPILAKLARDVLSVPVSTVASESAFSTGGRVLDPFRSSLNPTMVESLICAQDWLRMGKDPIKVEEDLESIRKHEEALKILGVGVVINEESNQAV
ncbi:zinc finger BED domain-containing protein DAYSLEEPER-like [Salvia miltiorrhiza]|uniref:zinc finger BED domain-containing protein DAYSLEEPER-like n=1 Tax=Salvia miltiorrhiza TaxID=226208 RepID=UPI0025ABF91C|nr:zinc finger BED domain-containing protein DAYSLEEPER-like [Salvia miltiorrhiza]